MRRIAMLLTIALAMGLWQDVSAQGQSESAILPVSAELVASINVLAIEELAFDEVLPGVPKRIRPLNIGGIVTPVIVGSVATGGEALGIFEVSTASVNNANIQLSFVLPSRLVHEEGLGAVPISFTSGDAGWSIVGTIPTTFVLFDPNVGTTAQTSASFASALHVYVGGNISPPTTAAAGVYRGEIVLTVTLMP